MPTPMAHLLFAAALASGPTHEVQPEDMFSLDSAGSISVSHTGAKAVFIRSRWNESSDRRKDDLWLVDTRTRITTRLTHGDTNVWAPQISSDDEWVYFQSKDEDKVSQVFRMHLDGSSIQQITRATHGVAEYELPESASALYYVTHKNQPTEDRWAQLRRSHGDVTYESRQLKRSEVHRVDLDTWRDELVVDPARVDAYVYELAVSPRERHVAMLTAPDNALVTHEGWSEVMVLERSTGTLQELPDSLWRAQAPSPYGWLLGLDWSSDDRALAFRVDFDGYPGETFVAEMAGGEPEVWKMPRPREVTPQGDSARWVPGKRDLCYLAAEQARKRVVCVTGVRGGSYGSDRTFPEGNAVIHRYAFSGDGRDIVAVASTPDRFAEVYRFPARGRLLPVPLTNLNPHTSDWKLPTLQLVSWTAPDGTTVEGVLETPMGWSKEDGPLPLVVQIHGGPTAATAFSRSFRQYGRTAFAAKGWALLSPNYRGSVGYGDTFLTQLIGQENDIEVRDILAGVDHLVAKGVADPDRMAVMGWSNGGFLTNALITHTDRFKAASSGAGVIDMTMQWGLEDTPGHVINYMEGLPWERAKHHQTASPLYALDKVTTPTLIHTGENDPRVPAAHARTLHRGLSVYREVASELLVYPGAGHGLHTWNHIAAKLSWDHAWFEHHVLGNTPTATEDAAVSR